MSRLDDLNKNQKQQKIETDPHGFLIQSSDTDFKMIMFTIFKEIKDKLEDFGRELESIFKGL